jgi:hypothetical protein
MMKRKVVKSIFTIAVLLTANGVARSARAFDGPPVPRDIPFVEGGKTYNAYVQTWHPHYASSSVCYYPTDYDPQIAPVLVSDGLVQFGYLSITRLLLNPSSFEQPWDSPDFTSEGVLCGAYYAGSWEVPVSMPTGLFYQQYGWNDWYFREQYGYHLSMTTDLVRAVGIDVRSNFTYDYAGQFDLGQVTTGQVVVVGSTPPPTPPTPPPKTQYPLTYLPNQFGWKFMSYADYRSKGKTYYVYHPAADLNALNDQNGDVPVKAIADGEIVANTRGWGGIVIRHEFLGKHYFSQYGHILHLTDETSLGVGKTVTKGQTIGFVGDIGSDGVYHLHFEIRTPLHPNPTLANYWDNTQTIQPDKLSRKNVFKAYESPLSFIDSYSDPNSTVVIVDDAVTYPGIQNDIIDNMIQFDVNADGTKEIVKKRFFRAANLQEWHPAYNGQNKGYEGNYHYAQTTQTSVSSMGRWYFDIPSQGNYEVFACIPSGSKTHRARYAIVHDSQMHYATVDQAAFSGKTAIDQRWVSLGIYSFQQGSNHFVQLSNKTGESGLQIGYDALKLIKR